MDIGWDKTNHLFFLRSKFRDNHAALAYFEYADYHDSLMRQHGFAKMRNQNGYLIDEDNIHRPENWPYESALSDQEDGPVFNFAEYKYKLRNPKILYEEKTDINGNIRTKKDINFRDKCHKIYLKIIKKRKHGKEQIEELPIKFNNIKKIFKDNKLVDISQRLVDINFEVVKTDNEIVNKFMYGLAYLQQGYSFEKSAAICKLDINQMGNFVRSLVKKFHIEDIEIKF